MTHFSIIVATDSNYGIGLNGNIPWHFSGDLKYFKETTKYGYVIMGRKTWESLPQNFKPLPLRTNIVISSLSSLSSLSSQKNIDNCANVFPSLDEALAFISEKEKESEKDKEKKIFVIGGEMLYKEAITHEKCNKIYINIIDNNYNCDRFFPKIDENIWKLSESFTTTENNIPITYNVYTK